MDNVSDFLSFYCFTPQELKPWTTCHEKYLFMRIVPWIEHGIHSSRRETHISVDRIVCSMKTLKYVQPPPADIWPEISGGELLNIREYARICARLHVHFSTNLQNIGLPQHGVIDVITAVGLHLPNPSQYLLLMCNDPSISHLEADWRCKWFLHYAQNSLCKSNVSILKSSRWCYNRRS